MNGCMKPAICCVAQLFPGHTAAPVLTGTVTIDGVIEIPTVPGGKMGLFCPAVMGKGGGCDVSIMSCPGAGPLIRTFVPWLVLPTLLPVITVTVPPQASAPSGAQVSISFLYTEPLLLPPVKLMSAYWLGTLFWCNCQGSPRTPPPLVPLL